jgi:hypothetical protein
MLVRTHFSAAFHNIHDVVDNPVFQPKCQVKVTKSDIRIHEGDTLIECCERHADIGRRCSFTNATFTRSYNDYTGICHVRGAPFQ